MRISIDRKHSHDVNNILQGKENVNPGANNTTDERGATNGAKTFLQFSDTNSSEPVLYWEASFRIYVYVAYESQSFDLNEDGDADESGSSTCTMSSLPNEKTEGLWESLIYDAQLKNSLLNYVSTAMYFSEHQVNQHLVACNRIVLCYGPPGTGKTSLCRALAHKLAIRMNRFESATLLEVNAHSLFSKWFSESGKLVARLFSKIKSLAEDEKALLFVLIDEVESLTAARKTALSGVEPSDALRVVNAVLTQLDSLRNQANCVILTTSNVTQAIDNAFTDRADLKQYIGPPSLCARYEILRNCTEELIRAKIIEADVVSIQPVNTAFSQNLTEDKNTYEYLLWTTSEITDGFSGRSLRKLPFLAHAHFLSIRGKPASLRTYLQALLSAARKEKKSNEQLAKANSNT